MPKVSVLMPSYNHELYIGDAIESILNQTWADLELVIVDDGSTDNSQELIKQYQKEDHRIRAYVYPINTRNSMNTILDLAKGEYATFCDSDDMFVPDKLEKQLAVVMEEGNENKVVIADGVSIDTNGAVTGPLFLGENYEWSLTKKKSGDIFNELLASPGLYFFRSTILFRRENVPDLRFDRRLDYLGEFKFALELAYQHQFHWLDDVVFKRRIHCSNEGAGWDEAVADHYRALIAKDFLKAPYRARITQDTQIHLFQVILRDALRRRDLQDLSRYALAFISYAPSLSAIKKYIAQGHDLSDVELTISGTGGEPMVLKGSDIVAGMKEHSLSMS